MTRIRLRKRKIIQDKLLGAIPGREAALKTENFVKFVKESPHPALGTYLFNQEGDKKWMSCEVAAGALDGEIEVLREDQRDQVKDVMAVMVLGHEKRAEARGFQLAIKTMGPKFEAIMSELKEQANYGKK